MHPRLFCCAGNWPDPCSSAALGYKGFTADELVQLKIHGVIPDYARSLQVHGMKNLNADQLVRLKISGFQPSFQ
ncbi:MAG TPA: hypothetical protein VFT40_14020 [Sphingomicrobium sp.]|nr:hypothetical protein [Sphingomicrobium sp.]